MTAVLDWRDPAHWNNGRHVPCHRCGQLTFLLDNLGRPCHKGCAEQAPFEMVEGGRG